MSRFLLLSVVAALALTVPADSQTTTRPVPRLEAVAETKLLMEGLANSNFKGLERLLSQKPENVDTWTFARGQALLIAETGNLLLLRPPKNEGQMTWQERAMELRAAARDVARATAARDLDASRAGLVKVADVCNRCHQTFRVSVRLTPFEQPRPGPSAE